MKIRLLSIVILLGLFAIGCQPKASPEYIEALDKHRIEYQDDFRKNSDGPLTPDGVEMMDFFEADEEYSCMCDLVIDEQPLVEMSTYAGKKKTFQLYARAKCKTSGKSFSVALFQHAGMSTHPIHGKKLFLPFKDETNGDLTYGGGRYMDLSKDNIVNNQLKIDFNRCYNPWCAYSDGFNCPIPPRENEIPLQILAGEKSFKGEVRKRG